MFYRVHAILAFTEEDEANDFYHDCAVALPKASVINPHTDIEETGIILLERCYHDESPSKPCETISSDAPEPPPLP